MRDIKVLRQRKMTRRFRRVVERRHPGRAALRFDITQLELLADLDPGFLPDLIEPA